MFAQYSGFLCEVFWFVKLRGQEEGLQVEQIFQLNMLFSFRLLDVSPGFLHLGQHLSSEAFFILASLGEIPDHKDDILGFLGAKQPQVKLENNFENGQLGSLV